MANVTVIISATAKITVDTTDALDSYPTDAIEEILEGSINDASDEELAKAMVTFDDEEGNIPTEEFEWIGLKVVEVRVNENENEDIEVEVTTIA